MMKYEISNYNFIPKDKGKQMQDNALANSKEKSLDLNKPYDKKTTNNELDNELLYLKKELEQARNSLKSKDFELEKLREAYDTTLRNTTEKSKITVIDSNSNSDTMKVLEKELVTLEEENDSLKRQVKNYKDHVHFLYILLLVLAVL
ncbi:hypothetical protein RH915_01130 [Serpentinicella sp. ANB-PHB4]|uniref:hypothetical protein n=1 Tax=Serpentinicella sp. ANB-PHB4 TaxID=3074076 RepID=UPI00286676C2|nr:hypothetical protein [Serpentinicella sp. ANB-PHB4]MDR5658081.1 hypothetical protein [Serpentinicella sp. ANB-PHB4]